MSDDKYASLIFRNDDVLTLQTWLMNIVCNILFIIGVIGNLLRFFIFCLSRRTWRISSVYACLAICSSIIDLLCVIRYASILYSTTQNILRELVGQKWWACKFYEFSFSFRVISSWITLFWMFERLMYVSTKLRSCFNRCSSFKLNFIIPIITMIIILSCVIGPSVYMFQPRIILNNNIMYCELSSNASIKWQKYFHEIHFGINHFTIRCLFSELIPTGMIILFNSCIIHHLFRTYPHLHRTSSYKLRKNQLRTTSWMNIVLIFHSFLLLSSLFLHIVGHFTVIKAYETWWVAFSVLINCSLNFYICCLSSEAFRNEIRRFIQQFKTQFFYLLQTYQDRRQRFSYHQGYTHEINNFQIRFQFNNISINNVV